MKSIVIASVVAAFCLQAPDVVRGQTAEAKSDRVPGITLGQVAAGEAKVVDLTYPLSDKSPFWPGDDYQPFQLRTIATLEKNGVLSKTIQHARALRHSSGRTESF